jgi:hypothetical protein
MSRKPKLPKDDPEQAKRFIETARKIGAAEDEEGAEKAIRKILPKRITRKEDCQTNDEGAESKN